MQKSPLRPFGASSDDTITLINGQTIPVIYVSFVPATYQFFYTMGGKKVDVTNQMTQAQKKLFPQFDVTENNYRIYNQKAFGVNSGASLDTSLSKAFVNELAKDLDKKLDTGVSGFSKTLGLVIGGYIVFLIITNLPKSKKK
jgi:hypothetical protein